MKSSLLAIAFLFIISANFAQVATNSEDVKPLLIGESIPSIKVISLDGSNVEITDIVKKQKTVLIFYRGGWCPYCNTHLSAIGELQETIKSLGYQTVAISPDAPEKLKESIEKNNLNYTLYSDSSTELIQKMGIALQAPERYTSKLLNYSDQNNSNVIPAPSVFIIARNGAILFQYTDANYKERISEEDLLEALEENR